MPLKTLSLEELQDYIWQQKYKADNDGSLQDTFRRVAYAAAMAEPESEREKWAEEFIKLFDVFLPGGRVLNCLGSGKKKTTPFNCFVSGTIDDSMESIFQRLREAALTMQAGGGVGFDFSTLRPAGAEVKGVGAASSGPLSFMAVYDRMCKTIASSGHRRGAMMAVMRIDHPDIEHFITAKRGDDNKAFQNFNLSVLVTDNFIEAVQKDRNWNLVFGGRVYKTTPARQIWEQIMINNYDYAEPGVIFIDRVNAMNSLNYLETITATNPCGEQPLPPFGACNLGSINLVKFVCRPFTPEAYFDYDLLKSIVPVAVRFLDDVIDVARLPLKEQELEVKSKRRIGLGVTGVGDAFWMLGCQYGDARSLQIAEAIAKTIRDAAFTASADLAAEKGSFPLYDTRYLDGAFTKTLPEHIRDAIKKHGIRNSHLLTIAPTGTTSLLWGNVSSGIEPILELSAVRKIKQPGDSEIKVNIDDYAYYMWKRVNNGASPNIKISSDISAKEHIDVMAVFQKYIDASISKTIIFPPNVSFEEFKETYLYAYNMGLKGCTVYRNSGKLDAVISSAKDIYVSPMKLPDYRIKHSIKVDTPEGSMYVDVTEVDGHPREVWVVTPVEAERPEDLDAICKLASIALRSNIHPDEVLKQITSSIRKYGHVSSMLAFVERGIRRGFAKIMGDGKRVAGKPCPVCGSPLVYQQGCVKCSTCDYDKCG